MVNVSFVANKGSYHRWSEYCLWSCSEPRLVLTLPHFCNLHFKYTFHHLIVYAVILALSEQIFDPREIGDHPG